MNIYFEQEEDFWPAPPPITKKQAKRMVAYARIIGKAIALKHDEIVLETFGMITPLENTHPSFRAWGA